MSFAIFVDNLDMPFPLARRIRLEEDPLHFCYWL